MNQQWGSAVKAAPPQAHQSQWGAPRTSASSSAAGSAGGAAFKVARQPQPVVVGSVPKEWQPQQSTSQLFVLPPNSEEYKQVAADFLRNNKQMEIMSISRHQNRRHWEQYALLKRQMDEDNARVDEKTPGSNEKFLFHGTNQDTVDKVCERGFNRSFSRRAAFGQGVYFAVSPSYSCSPGYAKPDPETGVQVVVRARVLAGEAGMGDRSAVDAPLRPCGRLAFDSAVDCVAHPQMHIIFRDNAAYCEHVVHFVQRGQRPRGPVAGGGVAIYVANPFGRPVAFPHPVELPHPVAMPFPGPPPPPPFFAGGGPGNGIATVNPFLGGGFKFPPAPPPVVAPPPAVAPPPPVPPPVAVPPPVPPPAPPADPVAELRLQIQERWRVETAQLQRMLEEEAAEHPGRAWDLQWQVESMKKQVETRLQAEMDATVRGWPRAAA